MSMSFGTLKKQTSRIVAILIVIIVYSFTRLPELTEETQIELASEFSFTPHSLPEPAEFDYKTVRNVSPKLEHISAWISSVGASVTIDDLDRDGLANDLCWVDVRTNKVIVAPVPGTGDRYPLITLDPAPLAYDTNSMAPTGCLSNDLNEDGYTDLLVYYWGRTPVAFLRKPDQFAYQPQEIYPKQERWFTNATTQADIDGDGHLDIIIGNYFPDGSGVIDPDSTSDESMQHSMSRAYNAGKNRLLLWAGITPGNPASVRYKEVHDVWQTDIEHGWTLSIGAADLDGDQRPEIYFGNDFGPDRLLHNQSQKGQPNFNLLEGEPNFALPASLVLGQDSFKGMGVDFGDINGDGLLDIYVSNIATEFALQESHFLWLSTGELEKMKQGIAPYVHGSEKLGLARSGWSWEARLADFNNDGVLEAVQATGFIKGEVNRWPELQSLGTSNDEVLNDPRFWPRFQPGDDLSGHEANAFFVRAEDGRYYDLAAKVGLGEPVVTRGIATADVDGDGDLDMVFANQWVTSTYYQNDCPDCGAFLGLHLMLPIEQNVVSNTLIEQGHPQKKINSRPAVGAAATIILPDGKKLVAQVDGGNGHSGSRAPQLHFGLGKLAQDTELKVTLNWRDPDGMLHEETHMLTPGWHTLYLAWPNTRS